MLSPLAKRIGLGVAGFFALWFGVKHFLPILTPFLLGGLLALAAEPFVNFFQHRLRLKRGLSALIGVSVTLILLLGLLSLLGAILIRELYRLADSVPDLEKTAKQGITVLENWAVNLAHKAPEGMQPVLERTVENTFSDSSILMDRLAQKVPDTITAILAGIPDSALLLGTGVLSAYMISARLPKIKALKEKLPPTWQERYLPAMARAKGAMLGWLRAQGILMVMIFAIVTVGFLLLKIPYGPFWALLIALLDAVPMLGTGLVLLPWAAVCFLMGQSAQAVGLLGIFATATIARSTVEPKLLGKHLGLDPLITLIALYAGYRIMGFPGLLIAPIVTAAVKSMITSQP